MVIPANALQDMVTEMLEVGRIIQPNSIKKARDEWNNDEARQELIQMLQKIQVQTILPELDEEGKIILELGAVIETRTQQLRNQSILEYLIKWKKLPIEDSTWEDKNFIQKHRELGGQEFYTETSRTTQVLRTTLFEGEGNVRSLYY